MNARYAILLAVSPSNTLDEAVLPGRTLPEVLLAERHGNGETDFLGSLTHGIGTISFPGDCHLRLHTIKKTMDILPSKSTYLAYHFRGLKESLKPCQPCWHHKSNRLYCLNHCWWNTYWVPIWHCPRCFIHITSLNSLHDSKRLFICISDKETRAQRG